MFKTTIFAKRANEKTAPISPARSLPISINVIQMAERTGPVGFPHLMIL
jgi:hypothetical protein